MILSSIPTSVYICSDGPRWNQRHKRPFPPRLQLISPIDRDPSHKCPTQPLVGPPGGSSSQPNERLSTSNLLPALLCHWPGPLKTPPVLSIVYKRTLNPDWDEMVLGNTNLPSIQFAGFLIKVIIPCSKMHFPDWFVCHSTSRMILGWVTYIYMQHTYTYICMFYTHTHAYMYKGNKISISKRYPDSHVHSTIFHIS